MPNGKLQTVSKVFPMRFVRYAIKFLAAGATALFILSVFTCLYNYIPLHIPNGEGTTDYVWPSNSPWVLMTEGFAWGRMDEKGFNNPRAIPDPDILFMGSSHIEAKNVMRNENACTLLEQSLKGRYKVYNIGMSGHDLAKVCHYIPAVLRKYENKPPAFLIIEASSVMMTPKMADDILRDMYRYRPRPRGFGVKLLQGLPVASFLYRRWENGLKKVFVPEKSNGPSPGAVPQESPSAQACGRLFAHLAALASKNGVKIVIVYHPREVFLPDGSITFLEKKWVAPFAAAAERNGIPFIDMSRVFEKMFSEEHHVPHGFANGKIGRGHLNRYGHRAVAKELEKVIAASEGKKSPCR